MPILKNFMSDKPKALVYNRVSSDRQKNEGHGLESQEHRCREYAAHQGYEVEKVFKDSFTGGGDFMKRPAMAEMLAYIDSKPHREYVVIFDDLSRLARDVVAHIKLRAAFNVRNVTPLCLNYNFDDSPEGEYSEIIMAANAQLFRKQNKRQVIQKQKARLEAGYWPFYPPPGFKHQKHPLHGKLLTADEPKASIIKEALEGFASGRFQEQIDVLNFLRAMGFNKGVRDGKIYLETVKRMLKRVLYAGYVEYVEWDVARRKGHHTGLVSLETYQKIQDKLNGSTVTFKRKDLNEDFPLRGLVNCASCHKPFTASWSSGRNTKFPYYRCKTVGCIEANKSIRREDIESGVETLLRNVRPRQEVLDYAKARLLSKWNKKVEEVSIRKQNREKELAGIRQEIRDYTVLAGKASSEKVRQAYESKLAELIDAELVLEEKVNNPELKQMDFGTAIESVFAYLKNPYEKWANGDMTEKRLLMGLIFSEKLEYDRNTGFGTASLALPLKAFEVIATSETVGCGDGAN
jgi:site-specific DNA recombinase